VPTRLAFLFGDPVSHSLSPVIHNAAFRAAGIDALYRAVRVPDVALGAAVAGLRAEGILGANVTIPHKQAVVEHLDALAPEARAIGAVNTIVRGGDGTLTGHNTDAAGFLAPLDPSALAGTHVLVFGNGGAARAVVYALLTAARPASLTLAARHPERAEALAADLGGHQQGSALRVVALPEAGPAVREAALIVNTTPLGMEPEVDATPWPDAGDFHEDQTVYDLVYAPRHTRLLRDAGARGARTIDGLAMLVGQAAEAFRLWTGRPMPLDAVRAALDQALSGDHQQSGSGVSEA
jgi:shikimate dehydrogenase